MGQLFGLKFWIPVVCFVTASLWNAFDLVSTRLAAENFDFSIALLNDWRFLALVTTVLMNSIILTPVWRWIWKLPIIGPLLSEKIFPDLNGRWQLRITTNWPVIRKLLDAATSNTDTFNPLTEENLPQSEEMVFEATIKQSWWRISIEIHPLEFSALDSSTTTTVHVANETNGDKRLTYLYEQKNKDIAPTDQDSFFGCGQLQMRSDGTFKGTYFTDRSWWKGINTAGTATLVRVV